MAVTLEEVRQTARILAQTAYFDFTVVETNGFKNDLKAWRQRQFVVNPQMLASLTIDELEFLMAHWIGIQRRHERMRDARLTPWTFPEGRAISIVMLGVIVVLLTLQSPPWLTLCALAVIAGLALGKWMSQRGFQEAIALTQNEPAARSYRDKLIRYKFTPNGLQPRGPFSRILFKSMLPS